MKSDTPANRTYIADMSDDEIDAFLTSVRDRRLKSIKAYEETEALRWQARIMKLDKHLDHQLKMFEKERGQMDRILAKVEKRVLQIRALRLQLEG
tara:strand:+ start:481 stop:765 length:285 start_codon:yes stop_codon:yes gene_type:complete